MFRRISENITSEMISAGVISNDEKEIYQYSMEVICAMAVNLIAAILLFAIFSRFLEGLLFLAAFIPLRTYSGGYHASTYLRCFILSIAVLLLMICILYLLPTESLFYIALFLGFTASAIIFVLTPIGSTNKPFDEKEKVAYRLISIRILGIEITALAGILVLGFHTAAFVVSSGMFAVSFSLLIGEMDNVIQQKRA